MADFDVFFYNQDPNGVFSTTIGGTTTYTGPASADGFATITDNEAGVRDRRLMQRLFGHCATRSPAKSSRWSSLMSSQEVLKAAI